MESTLKHLPFVADRLPVNVPRSMWEWEASWEGHSIAVRNWFDLFRRGGIELVIDGITEPQSWEPKLRERHFVDLYGVIYDSKTGKIHEVHAHVGRFLREPTIGCVISVDGVPVGGDIGKRFLT